MSRKSLILCLVTLAALLLGLGVAIAVLYSDTEGGRSGSDRSVSFEGERRCLAAVPSDAVLVTSFESTGAACNGVLARFAFPAAIAEKIGDGTLASLKRSSMAVSLHYASKLQSLYVVSLDRATDAAVLALEELVGQSGIYCSRAGDFMVMSASETLIKSSVRHVEKNVSVADAPGFADALAAVDGKDILLMSSLNVRKLMQNLFTGQAARHYPFVERLADWMAYDISSSDMMPVSFDGVMFHEGESDEFLTVLQACRPGISEVAKVLPSYTLSAVTLPLKDIDGYVSSYRSFIDSRQELQNFDARQKSLKQKAGIGPEELIDLLDIKELASASVKIDSRIEKVNLVRCATKDASLIFKGNDVQDFKDCRQEVYRWAYPAFIGSVFGPLFQLPDESCFTYVDGWIITGSESAVEEYVSKGALDYTLEEFMADAGKASLFSEKPSSAVVYLSLTEDPEWLSSCLKQDLSSLMSGLTDEYDYSPAIFTLAADKDGVRASFDIHTLTMQKTKAPVHERDTTVTVPSGPFEVRNSGTGKTNTFYQNSKLAICLRDENGKDLWGVPFGKPICGTAWNLDYYGNGKLQIIFGAGSTIYVIDRLGRYVNGFPVDLGKEITLGPDIYDFSGAHRYNILVLHSDNTVQMYNLKGKKPDGWKGITTGETETIKSLPERLTVGGKDFWVVRTSIQTLVYPFYGGSPLTEFDGDSKIRPDSQMKVVDDTSVQAMSYDGKTRTIKLR